MKFRTFAVTALTAGLLAGCASSAASSTGTAAASNTGNTGSTVFRTVDEIKDSGTIKIAVFSDKAPFGYVDEDGEYQGYDVYYAKRIAEDLGVEVEFTPVSPAARIDIVNSGQVDITLANFTVTDERAEQVDFTAPYMKVALGVVSPDSAVITDVSQLEEEGKKLIVAKGTTAETYFEDNYPNVTLSKYDEYADAYNALLTPRDGEAAFSTDNTEVLAWANSNKGYTVGITELGDYDAIAPAVAKGNTTLADFLNEEIKTLGEEQFFHKDFEETLRPVYGEAADADNMVVEGGKME